MKAVIFGASGGIGRALVAALRQSGQYERVRAGSRDATGDFAFDLKDEASIRAAAEDLSRDAPFDLIIVATGLLHREGGISPEKSSRMIDGGVMAELFAVNTIGPALIAKHCLPLLHRDRRAIFAVLSARVGSIGDNRAGGWHSYRASKAALNMLVRNFAIELAQRNPQAMAVALHPGTVDTPLSGPFQRNVPPDRLFTPERSAAALLRVIDGLSPGDSGGLFAWDGARISF